MDVWLYRHAEAEDHAPSGRDSERRLTGDGLRRAEQVARGLRALEPGIAAIWCSPYLRALQTARPAAGELDLTIRESAALEPERPPEDVLRELAAEGVSEDILLVGHQPHLGALLGRLIAGPHAQIPMGKASVARIRIEGRWSGTLRALLPAAVLERIAPAGPPR